MRIILYILSGLMILTLYSFASCAQQENKSGLIETIMKDHPEKFEHILNNLDAYELQVIYTQIDRDENNQPTFTRHYFNVDSSHYFYPASTVKMPIAFMALEKLHEAGITRDTPMYTDSAYSGQSMAFYDSSSQTLRPSIGNYIRKIFLVSDNDSFNRLYEFVGQAEIQDKLLTGGYDGSRIIHRLSIALSEDENRHTNPIIFVEDKDTVAVIPAQFNRDSLPDAGPVFRGKGFLTEAGVVNEPMDFTHKNFIPLEELTDMLAAVIFPRYSNGVFRLTKNDYDFLRQAMSQLPRESKFPAYDQTEYYDAYAKFLMYGSDSSTVIPNNIRIFNKIGLAYGYTTDVAYIIDTENNIEFMLSATIHTNANEIYNDGIYEYEEIAFPFMRDLGQSIYAHERTRQRSNVPDLQEFTQLNYN